MFIHSSSTISHQRSFQNVGFSNSLEPLNLQSELRAPDFSQHIPALDRRRMDKLMRMSMTAALDAIEQSGRSVNGIIVGSGLGMGAKTAKFMRSVKGRDMSPISPTAFTVSTHNTLAGQISLRIKNKGYNTTISQNSLSLEHCLIDANLGFNEGMDSLLIGTADGEVNELYNMEARLGIEKSVAGSGASYFVLSSESKGSFAKIVMVKALHDFGSLTDEVAGALNEQRLESSDIDLVIFSTLESKTESVISELFPKSSCINYLPYCGHYLTSSAFGLAVACDQILTDVDVTKVLIIGNMLKENLGLILIDRK